MVKHDDSRASGFPLQRDSSTIEWGGLLQRVACMGYRLLVSECTRCGRLEHDHTPAQNPLCGWYFFSSAIIWHSGEASITITKRCSRSDEVKDDNERAFFYYRARRTKQWQLDSWNLLAEPLVSSQNGNTFRFRCSRGSNEPSVYQRSHVEWLLLATAFSICLAMPVSFGSFGGIAPSSFRPSDSHKIRRYALGDQFLRLEPMRKRIHGLRRWKPLLIAAMGVLCFLNIAVVHSSAEDTNLRQNIIEGNVRCIHYDEEKALFWMTCDLTWDAKTYISLGANETFDGGGTGSRVDGQRVIDLTGIEDFVGLFTVQADVKSFAEAPLIQNVHVINGTTARHGGFIIQREQGYFIVDSCSSTGDIDHDYGGGICGYQCGYQGEIRISNSYSMGKVKGQDAGGIAGDNIGREGIAHITQCHSTGDIKGIQAGGISGDGAGYNGKLIITQSFSTGDILGNYTGGITGGDAGNNEGYVYIRECYSKGKISGYGSGGISGDDTSKKNGEVHITDSYSLGTIQGAYAGGISGDRTGNQDGDVYIKNTYSSGRIKHANAGGLLGGIAAGSDTTVDVRYSVYNHTTYKIVGDGDTSLITTNLGNSYDVRDIKGKLYTFDGTQQWSSDIWTLTGTNKVPVLRFQVDLRQPIIDGNVECLHYYKEEQLFRMTCDVLKWKWTASTFISLGANETFDGGRARLADDSKGIIDLTGIKLFKGLFRVNANDVGSVSEAPLIRNVHVKNGTTASGGGFIVQNKQKYFIIDSCSSTGDIRFYGSGGICGAKSGYKGDIRISNSYSTGKIKGPRAGGIAGARVGENGIARTTHCYSTGDIDGNDAGGISGAYGGVEGTLNITQSYSTGGIFGDKSGGITGRNTGYNYGYVNIRECFTNGEIFGKEAGGICGGYTAIKNGEVHIRDCYSRGNIKSDEGGGISGKWTGWDVGDVYIENTYASGSIESANAGGLIGNIDGDRDIVDVKYSVYNHSDSSKIVGDGDGSRLTTNRGNSYDVNEIIGKLYTFNGTQQWSNEIWTINGNDELPILRFQLLEGESTPTPSPALTRAPSPARSPSQSVTLRPTASSTTTGTSSHSATPSPTTTGTDTPASTRSPSRSVTQTATPWPTATGTPSPTATPTTSTPNPTSSASSTASRSPTRSVTSIRSPTTSASPSATKASTKPTSPRRLTTKKILPVQRPARLVETRPQGGRQNRKRRKKK